MTTEFWSELWMKLFGTDMWLGVDIGFWVAMAVILLVVIVENAIFWGMKPKVNSPEKKQKERRNDHEI